MTMSSRLVDGSARFQHAEYDEAGFPANRDASVSEE